MKPSSPILKSFKTYRNSNRDLIILKSFYFTDLLNLPRLDKFTPAMWIFLWIVAVLASLPRDVIPTDYALSLDLYKRGYSGTVNIL